ncbi:hypothetical protein [Nocardia sp. SYP-A9097]|uniref:hypothetical protein n=1 Tax=Nocardia sp. SYP-A9097 TaxID=2663237 RepID=UPI0018912077|nr:hypothetical protein [Nocardia sp. SYP-A9097]
MTTISHVRGCLPSTMVTFGAALTTGNTEFTKQVGNMSTAVDKTTTGWKGAASAAATAGAISQKLTGTRIDEVVTSVAEYYKTYGSRLDGTRTALLTIVDNSAPAAGMTVADDGTVTAPRYPHADGPLVASIMQARLDGQARWFQTQLQELLKDFGDGEDQAATSIKVGVEALATLKEKPTAPMPTLPSIPPPKSPDGKYTIGDPKEPFLAHDDTFIYNSKDSNFGDWLNKQKWQAKLLGGEYVKSDFDDASALYRHYWDNNGKKMEFDYDEAYREDKNIRNSVDSEISRAAMAADYFAKTGNTNFKITGAPNTVGKGNNYPETENWQKAIGGHQQWSHANVRVEGNRVVMDVTVEAQDYYDFDKGKHDVGTGAPDSDNGRFTEIGWAKPFESHGTLTRTVSWDVGEPPSSGVTADTSSPSRNPGREDRSDGRGDGDNGRMPDNNRNTGGARPK